MKSFTKITIPALALIFLFGTAFSQKKKHKHDDDATVTIKIDGREHDLEAREIEPVEPLMGQGDDILGWHHEGVGDALALNCLKERLG